MNLSKLIKRSYWRIDWEKYRELYGYDLKFNASFRCITKFTKQQLQMPELKYIKLYRLTQAAYSSIWYKLLYHRLVKYGQKTGIGLSENMNIPRGLIIGHAGTIIMNGEVKFSENIMLTHGVTVGRDIRGKRAGTPTFGKNVCIRCNSTIVGNISIGDDVLIAPNTFVNFDVPSHSVVIGNPATIHHKENATEGHIGRVE